MFLTYHRGGGKGGILFYYGGPQQIGPTAHAKTYQVFISLFSLEHYFVLFTINMAPCNNQNPPRKKKNTTGF